MQKYVELSDEFKSSFKEDLVEVTEKEVVSQWVSGYYDGPLSGMAKFADLEVWYNNVDERYEDWPNLDPDEWEETVRYRYRSFVLFKLTKDQMIKMKHNRKLWNEHGYAGYKRKAVDKESRAERKELIRIYEEGQVHVETITEDQALAYYVEKTEYEQSYN